MTGGGGDGYVHYYHCVSQFSLVLPIPHVISYIIKRKGILRLIALGVPVHDNLAPLLLGLC
jgi:hypothetical protein